MPSIYTWGCKCGASIKAIAHYDTKNPRQQISVSCPKCSDRQLIYGYKLISVEAEESITHKKLSDK